MNDALFLPIAVSLWLLISLWRNAELFGWQEGVFGAWFVAAALLQLLAQSPTLWLIGLLAQVALAIVLVLKDRIDHTF